MIRSLSVRSRRAAASRRASAEPPPAPAALPPAPVALPPALPDRPRPRPPAGRAEAVPLLLERAVPERVDRELLPAFVPLLLLACGMLLSSWVGFWVGGTLPGARASCHTPPPQDGGVRLGSKDRSAWAIRGSRVANGPRRVSSIHLRRPPGPRVPPHRAPPIPRGWVGRGPAETLPRKRFAETFSAETLPRKRPRFLAFFDYMERSGRRVSNPRPSVAAALERLSHRGEFTSPDDHVFANRWQNRAAA
jgi:hypothetical protein